MTRASRPDLALHADAPCDTALAALDFSVAYRFHDYLDALREHASRAVVRRRHAAGTRRSQVRAPLIALPLVALVLHACGALQPLNLAVCAATVLVLASRLSLPLWMLLIGMPLYCIKRVQIPVCTFHIDATGVTRSSARGTLFRPWGELVTARVGPASTLLAFSHGAVPIPTRCLSASQAVQLRAFLAQARH